MLVLLFVFTASADPIVVGGGWTAFCFGGPGSPAVAGGCVDPTGGNPFTWTSTQPVFLTITDTFLHGDTFSAIDSVAGLVLTTPVVAAGGSTCAAGGGFGSDPNCAVLDPLYSHGSVFLSAGFHSIDIFTVLSPFAGGQANLRVDAVPEPGTLLLLGTGLLGLGAKLRKRFT